MNWFIKEYYYKPDRNNWMYNGYDGNANSAGTVFTKDTINGETIEQLKEKASNLRSEANKIQGLLRTHSNLKFYYDYYSSNLPMTNNDYTITVCYYNDLHYTFNPCMMYCLAV